MARKRSDVRAQSPLEKLEAQDSRRYGRRDALERVRLVSFNNEGFINEDEMIDLLKPHGVALARFDYKRYVGAQIGVHNPQGRRRKVSHLRNRELLFALLHVSAGV